MELVSFLDTLCSISSSAVSSPFDNGLSCGLLLSCKSTEVKETGVVEISGVESMKLYVRGRAAIGYGRSPYSHPSYA